MSATRHVRSRLQGFLSLGIPPAQQNTSQQSTAGAQLKESFSTLHGPTLSAPSFLGLLSSPGLSPQPLLGVLLRNWQLLSGLSAVSIFKPLKWPLSSCRWWTSQSTHVEVKVNLHESVFSFCPAAFRDQWCYRTPFQAPLLTESHSPHIPLLMSPPDLESRPHQSQSHWVTKN